MREDRLPRIARRPLRLLRRNGHSGGQRLHPLRQGENPAQRRRAGLRTRSGPLHDQRHPLVDDRRARDGQRRLGASGQAEIHLGADRRRHLHLRDAPRLRIRRPQRLAHPRARGLHAGRRAGTSQHVPAAGARQQRRPDPPTDPTAATAPVCPTVRANWRA